MQKIEKEGAMTVKERREGYVEGIEGGNGRRKCHNYVIVTKIKKKEFIVNATTQNKDTNGFRCKLDKYYNYYKAKYQV